MTIARDCLTLLTTPIDRQVLDPDTTSRLSCIALAASQGHASVLRMCRRAAGGETATLLGDVHPYWFVHASRW